MKLRPANMDVPLTRRDWGRLWVAILAGVVGWLWHRPMNIPDAAVSVVVGGAAIWLAFASTLSWRRAHHRMLMVRVLWLIGCVVALVWFMRTAVPYLHGLV